LKKKPAICPNDGHGLEVFTASCRLILEVISVAKVYRPNYHITSQADEAIVQKIIHFIHDEEGI
jgi:hypothetical protein